MEEVKGIFSEDYWGSKSTFISHVGYVESVFLLYDFHQVVVYLCAYLHCVGEVAGSCGKNHDLLEGHAVASVFASVDDVERRSGKDVFGSC